MRNVQFRLADVEMTATGRAFQYKDVLVGGHAGFSRLKVVKTLKLNTLKSLNTFSREKRNVSSEAAATKMRRYSVSIVGGTFKRTRKPHVRHKHVISERKHKRTRWSVKIVLGKSFVRHAPCSSSVSRGYVPDTYTSHDTKTTITQQYASYVNVVTSMYHHV